MKITRIDTFLVNVGRRNWPFVKVHTDEDGLYGVGEAYSCGPDRATVEVIRDFESWLVGHDPCDVGRLWHLMYAGSRFPPGVVVSAAISGIEQALWDIAGKAAGLPVHRLLGGKYRDRIRVYCHVRGDTPQQVAEHARQRVQNEGFSALKMSPLRPGSEQMPWSDTASHAAERLAAVRRAVGDDVDIGLDPHATIFEPAQAHELCRVLEPYRPFFVEEPLRPEHYAAMARLSHKVEVPIATGEMLYNKYQFRDLLALQAVDIVQPDICITGVGELLKIAALAESHYVTVAPHNPCGPVANAVNAQVAATFHNFLILEYLPDNDEARRSLVDHAVPLVDGYLELSERPGWGIDLNEEILSKYPYRPWRRPHLTRPDGAQAFQ